MKLPCFIRPALRFIVSGRYLRGKNIQTNSVPVGCSRTRSRISQKRLHCQAIAASIVAVQQAEIQSFLVSRRRKPTEIELVRH